MLVREVGQPVDHGLQRWQQHGVARGFQHHAVRGVIDVFRSTGKVDELACGDQFRHVLHLFLQPVFDRFHIVIRDRLDLLDTPSIRFGEVGGDAIEQGAGVGGKGLDLVQAGSSQRLKPGNFHFDPVVHETGFGQDGAQFVGLRGIAAVEWGKGCQG